MSISKLFIKNALATWLVAAVLEGLEDKGEEELMTLVILYSWCFAYVADHRTAGMFHEAPRMVEESFLALERAGWKF